MRSIHAIDRARLGVRAAEIEKMARRLRAYLDSKETSVEAIEVLCLSIALQANAVIKEVSNDDSTARKDA